MQRYVNLAWDSKQIRGSIVVSISACHAEDLGSIPGRGVGSELMAFGSATNKVQGALWPRVFTRSDSANSVEFAETRDRAGDLQIFSLTLSQLSYRGLGKWATPRARLGARHLPAHLVRNFVLQSAMTQRDQRGGRKTVHQRRPQCLLVAPHQRPR